MDEKQKPLRQWELWVFKGSYFYVEPGTYPIIGGRKTCAADFEWVRVKEVRKKKRPSRSKKPKGAG